MATFLSEKLANRLLGYIRLLQCRQVQCDKLPSANVVLKTEQPLITVYPKTIVTHKRASQPM